MHENPEVKNAMNMITVCKNENRGMNCRGLAIALNECYLALGFKSRFITCLPKDTTDRECHVINMIYSNILNKWLWIDPTSDAYVMDEKGELLSIEEVRERIISGKTLIVNPDANRNHKISDTKEEYLYNYMAKNLYRFQCPVISEHDIETKEQEKKISYIELLPLNNSKQPSDKTESINKENEITTKIIKKNNLIMTIIIYKTNNSTLFWQVPTTLSDKQ